MSGPLKMPAWICAALLALLGCELARSAAAAAVLSPVRERKSAALWRELAHPGERRAQALLRSALVQEREALRLLPLDWPLVCRRALAPGFGEESLVTIRGRARAVRELARQAMLRRARLDGALERLQLAERLAPDEPAIGYARARMLLEWEQPLPLYRCGSERRDDEAIAVLEQLRARHPAFAPSAVAFDLAVALTRRARFADAARVYHEAIAIALDPNEVSVVRSNLAEVTMLSGDLESAITHYERALRGAGGGRDRLLPLWGLSVALDRLGEHDAALEQAQRALKAEGGRMSVLRSDGVFFEPEHEIHYYEALGHEALANDPDGAATAAQELAAAAMSLQRYLAAAGPSGPFTAAARASLERIERARAQLGRIKTTGRREGRKF